MGGVVSTIEITCVQNEWFWQQSVAIQTAVIVSKHGGLLFVVRLCRLTVTAEQQASVAVGALNDQEVPHCTV